jgi:hypothetical protein
MCSYIIFIVEKRGDTHHWSAYGGLGKTRKNLEGFVPMGVRRRIIAVLLNFQVFTEKSNCEIST